MADTESFTCVVVPIDLREIDEGEPNEGGVRVRALDREVEVSAASLSAVRLSQRLTRNGGKVHLVHATPALDRGAALMGYATISGALTEVHRVAREMSLDALANLAREVGIEGRSTYEARGEPPVDLILDEADRVGADLIVLATSGRSRVARFFLGSTADRVIRSAKVPVLVIPARRE